MYYEINVSLNGQHFFATAERSLTRLDQAEKMYALFQDLFPTKNGFQLQLSRYEITGKVIKATA